MENSGCSARLAIDRFPYDAPLSEFDEVELGHCHLVRTWGYRSHNDRCGKTEDATRVEPIRDRTGSEFMAAVDAAGVGEGYLAKAKRSNRRNDDLMEAAQDFWPHILRFYKRFEEKRPVMLLDLPSQKIYAYPYKEFKDTLSPRSQAMLESEYEDAITQNLIVVFVKDNETRRMVSMSFHNE